MIFWSLFRKELGSYFGSIIAYMVLAISSGLCGWFFYSNLIRFDLFMSPQGISLTEGLFRQLFHDITLVMSFTIPLLTMRLFAEEKKMGTIELLWTYPLKDGVILLAKLGACVTVFIVLLGLTILYPLLLAFIWDVEVILALSGYLGIFLLGCAFISLGLFISSLTENQIVAGMVSFGIILLFMVAAFATGGVSGTTGSILMQLSLLEHIDTFGKGIIETKAIIHFLNSTLFFLFLGLLSLKSRKWRGLR